MVNTVHYCRLKLRELANTVRQVDEKLMRLVTYSIFYPDPNERPQTRLAILATLLPLNISILAIALENSLALSLTLPLWLITLYEWRLWYRLRKRKTKRDE